MFKVAKLEKQVSFLKQENLEQKCSEGGKGKRKRFDYAGDFEGW